MSSFQADDELPPNPRFKWRSNFTAANQSRQIPSHHPITIRRNVSNFSNNTTESLGINENGSSTFNLRKSGTSAKSNVALKMSTIHVTTFVACWTPYLVISLWHILDADSVQKVSPIVQDILFLTAVLNSCINPFVYGGFYFKNFRWGYLYYFIGFL